MLQHSSHETSGAEDKQATASTEFSDKFVTAVQEKHLHYANQYADMLENKGSRLEFATQ